MSSFENALGQSDVYRKPGLPEARNRIQKVNRVNKGIQIVNNEEQKDGKEKKQKDCL